MNILPKKSWHVRTKKNIERVRRDEQNAIEEKKQEDARIALAEQEARTTLLRLKRRSTSSECTSIVKYENNINFFKNEEESKNVGGTNKDYELEKKAEKEKFEKNIGLLTYLGQSSVEASTSKPWYFVATDKRKRDDIESDEEKDVAKKKFHDPLKDFLSYVHHTKRVKPNEDKLKILQNLHKRKSGSSKSIEQLRAERLQREQAERLRAENLVAKYKGENVDQTKEIPLAEKHQRYNSQFNPHLARQNRTQK